MCVVTAGGAARADAAFKATVTLDGVHYTLPTYFKDHALEPRRPLCHTFEYATIVIVVRDLFINGQLMYRGRAGDDVVVRYPYEVQVNGLGAATRANPRPISLHRAGLPMRMLRRSSSHRGAYSFGSSPGLSRLNTPLSSS